ncbi:MAG: NrfD/PsrC family molybdoenzyme membrane anchor subunit [Sulfolobales archaeon]
MSSNIIFNDVWTTEIAVEMTLLAVASFSIVYAFISYLGNRLRDALVGGLISAILPIGALLILYRDLLKPEAAYLIFTSLQLRSWMVYGAAGISLLIILSALFSVMVKFGFNRSLTTLLGLLASTVGVFVAIYPGLLLSYERGISFWHGCALPVLSLLMGLVGGSSVYIILKPLDKRISMTLSLSLIGLLIVFIIHLYFVGVYPVGSYILRLMSRDPLFVLGILLSVIGSLLGFASLKYRVRYIQVIIAIIGLVSIFIFRYVILSYGAWEYPLL